MKTKSTYLFFFILSLGGSAISQSISGPATVENYSLSQKRLLLVSTAQFINFINQDKVDPDSAMSIACRVTHLPYLLPYTECFDDKHSSSTGLINAGKIMEAKQLLNRVSGEQRIQLLMELAIWFLHQPETHKADLDSAAHYIRIALRAGASPQVYNECLKQLGEVYYQSGDTAESKKIYSSLFSSAEKEGNIKTMANASQQLGRLTKDNDSINLRYFNTALSLYLQLKLKENEIEVLWDIAKIYLNKNNALMRKYMLRILDLEKSSGFKHLLYTEYTLCYLTLFQTDYIGALEYANAGLANVKWSGFNEIEPAFFTRMGATYAAFGKYEEALSWFNKAIARRYTAPRVFWYKSLFFAMPLLSSMNGEKAAISLIDNVTKEFPPATMWEKMQVLTCKGLSYEKLHNYRSADETYTSFYKLITGIPGADPYGEFADDLRNIVIYYISQKNIKKARLFMDVAFSNTYNFSSNMVLNEKYLLLYKIDSLRGDYRSALQNHIKYKYYFDLFTNIDQRQRLDELTVKYEAEKKDQDIQLLKQRGIAQQAELKQNKLTRNITIGGIGLLLVIIALLLNQYRVKQSSNNAINKKNAALNKLVDEKEWLLKEVHHRVKNNLQTVVSLLELQSENLHDEALSAIHDSQNRIYVMSLIHQKLYQTDKIASINMQPYLLELSNHLRDIYSPQRKIHFDIQVAPLELDISQAIPVGLIVNEAVTNSIKYAFDHSVSNPEISIVLGQNNKQNLKLIIADNGVGLPLSFNINDTIGLGYKLMNALAEDIEGKLTVESKNGAVIKVLFNASITFDERAQNPEPEKSYAI